MNFILFHTNFPIKKYDKVKIKIGDDLYLQTTEWKLYYKACLLDHSKAL